MRVETYYDLVPANLRSEHIPINEQRDLVNLGYGSLKYLRDYWGTQVKQRETEVEKIKDQFDLDRMYLVSTVQLLRERVDILEGLIMKAENKPAVFRDLDCQVGDQIWCALPETKRVFVKCSLWSIGESRNGRLMFTVAVIDGRQKYAYLKKKIKTSFCPDRFFVIPDNDLGYLRRHPNFFRKYLYVYADTEKKKKMVEDIVTKAFAHL